MTFIVVLIFFVYWLFIASQPVVEVAVDGKSCYFTEADFQLRWMHSVEKQWWEEHYQSEPDGLLLTTTYFQAFGAGTPSTEQPASIHKSGYVGYQINHKFPQLNWVVSRLTQGEIDYAGHRILLHRWVPDYSEVIIKPKSYHLIDRIKKDFCDDFSNTQSEY